MCNTNKTLIILMTLSLHAFSQETTGACAPPTHRSKSKKQGFSKGESWKEAPRAIAVWACRATSSLWGCRMEVTRRDVSRKKKNIWTQTPTCVRISKIYWTFITAIGVQRHRSQEMKPTNRWPNGTMINIWETKTFHKKENRLWVHPLAGLWTIFTWFSQCKHGILI